MKKIALFLGGVLAGMFSMSLVHVSYEDMVDETLCDTDEYTIKLASKPFMKQATAFVYYK